MRMAHTLGKYSSRHLGRIFSGRRAFCFSPSIPPINGIETNGRSSFTDGFEKDEPSAPPVLSEDEWRVKFETKFGELSESGPSTGLVMLREASQAGYFHSHKLYEFLKNLDVQDLNDVEVIDLLKILDRVPSVADPTIVSQLQPALLRLIADEVMDPSDCVRACRLFARCRIPDHKLYFQVGEYLAGGGGKLSERLDRLSSPELASLMSSFASVGEFDYQVILGTFHSISSRIEKISGADCAVLLHSLARMRCRDDRLLLALLMRMEKVIEGKGSAKDAMLTKEKMLQYVTMCLWALSKLQFLQTSVMVKLVDHASGVLQDYGEKAREGHLKEGMPELPALPTQLAMLCSSIGRLGGWDDAVFSSTLELLLWPAPRGEEQKKGKYPFLASMDTLGLAMLLDATCSHLGHVSPRALLIILSELHSRPPLIASQGVDAGIVWKSGLAITSAHVLSAKMKRFDKGGLPLSIEGMTRRGAGGVEINSRKSLLTLVGKMRVPELQFLHEVVSESVADRPSAEEKSSPLHDEVESTVSHILSGNLLGIETEREVRVGPVAIDTVLPCSYRNLMGHLDFVASERAGKQPQPA